MRGRMLELALKPLLHKAFVVPWFIIFRLLKISSLICQINLNQFNLGLINFPYLHWKTKPKVKERWFRSDGLIVKFSFKL